MLVVGGGPAGLAAALAAGRMGARVMLADEQAEFGGQLLSSHDERIDGMAAADWVAAAVAELGRMPEVTLLPRTTAFGYHDHNFVELVERLTDHLGPGAPGPRQRYWKLRARQVVLAAGAIERPLVFADNDRPGIMLASAARSYANRYGVAPGDRVLLFTSNDAAYRTALDLVDAGVAIAGVVDLRPEVAGALPAALRLKGIEILAGHAVTGTSGRQRIAGATVMALNAAGDGVSGPARQIACDTLLMSGGWNPAVHLFSQCARQAPLRRPDPELRAGRAPEGLPHGRRDQWQLRERHLSRRRLRRRARGGRTKRGSGGIPAPRPPSPRTSPRKRPSARSGWCPPTARSARAASISSITRTT